MKTAASVPWNKTAMSLVHNLLTDSSGVEISLNRWASFAGVGRPGSLIESVAIEVIS